MCIFPVISQNCWSNWSLYTEPYVLPLQMSVAVSRVDYELLQTEHCTELKNWSESSDFQKLWHLWNYSPEHAHGERRISREKNTKKLCAFFIPFRFSLRFVFELNIQPVSKSSVHRKMSTNEYQLEYCAYLNQLHIYFTAGIMTIG